VRPCSLVQPYEEAQRAAADRFELADQCRPRTLIELTCRDVVILLEAGQGRPVIPRKP